MDLKDVQDKNEDETKIVDYLLQKFSEKLNDKEHLFYVITKNGELYDLNTYENLLKGNPNISKAYIFIANLSFNYNPVSYYCPFLSNRGILSSVYFLKYHYESSFSELKYIALISYFSDINKTIMEVVELDFIIYDLSLIKRRHKGSGMENEVEEHFARHSLTIEPDFQEAEKILNKYYRENDESLAQKVDTIKTLYYYRFRPHRIILSPTLEKLTIL